MSSNEAHAKKGGVRRFMDRLGKMFKPTEEQQIDKDITNHMQDQLKEATISILLLGAGGSGKTTVLKQMERMHGITNTMSMKKRQSAEPIAMFSMGQNSVTNIPSMQSDQKPLALNDTSNAEAYQGNQAKLINDRIVEDVHKNIIADIHDLCIQNVTMRQNGIEECALENKEMEALVLEISENQELLDPAHLSLTLANKIFKIWNDPGIQHTFEIRKKSHIMDNTPYFLDRVMEIANIQYQGTFDDYVRVREQTTGVVTTYLNVSQHGRKWHFHVTDVGGQKSERRKWAQLFEGIDIVIWIMSLAGYDQVLYEDNNINCYQESLTQFAQIVHQKAFKKTDFVVFLNKSDIFVEKIQKVPFTVYEEKFPEEDAKDAEKVIRYIHSLYHKMFQDGLTPQQKNQKLKNLFIHTTCATDHKQIETVLQDLQTSMIQRFMRQAALL